MPIDLNNINTKHRYTTYERMIALKHKIKDDKEVYEKRYRRGEVYLADLGIRKGSEQGGVRPVVIIQNDVGNRFSPTVIAISMTSGRNKRDLPTHVNIEGSDYTGLKIDSTVLAEQIVTLDKVRLLHKVDEISKKDMREIERAVLISFGFSID